ncbi:2-amino-4-hydroxy-6-hydroxymethyldihydropteridine diphosphokinase [uncultured Roseovarius sp.]|uniref:2-amino-4-hydroxy-6- hydroxymethyldihydropteridine diphosphokinase n=1 Tax=uncultured Roseovarius sp. TaxID=293344 RepID=UPI00261D2988|nr:2-amino-4-hydroxy-6-hydroxymethyldihydropteridine diphosphokinase [uncultured Roseovarius sp.]
MGNDQQLLIALGGNLPSQVGPPALTLRAALQQLERAGIEIKTVSRFYSTPCFPPGAGPDYVNAAAQVAYRGPVENFLQKLHATEAQFGRERVERWGRRTLDLDLIAAGQLVHPDIDTHTTWRSLPPDQQTVKTPDRLILPHPRLQDRAFVLVPLAEIAPEWCHPVLNLSVAQMLAALPEKDKSEVVAL